MKHQLRTLLAALAAVALTALIAVTVHPAAGPNLRSLEFLALAWVVFAAGVLLLRGVPVRRAVALILIGGAAMQFAATTERPRGSDDLYRYVWDGRVQAAGIDPYEYVPSAPQLDTLRTPDLWPAYRTAWCVDPGTPDPDEPGLLTPGCTFINRPTVHTIYPPVAEAYFLTVHVLSPPGSGYKTIQLAAALLALAVTGAVMLLLRMLRRDVRLAALWAWCPLVALEAGNNGHVDVLSSFLTVCALGLFVRARTTRSTIAAAVLLGLAVATKLTPAFAGPAVLRRRPVLVASAVFSAFLVVYLPHVAAVGSKVIGFLPGYLQEQGYDSGSGFTLLSLVVPGRLAAGAAVAVLAVVALAVYRRADPDRPWSGTLVMTGAALLVTTPDFPWYGLLVCALVAIDGRAEWLAVAAAPYLSALMIAAGWEPVASQRAGYGIGLIIVLCVTLRRRRVKSTRPIRPSSSPPENLEPTMPLVDVVLPCLDEAGALPYVLSRMPPGYRAIVVDNGSSDGSAQIAAELGALVVTEPRRGFGAACHAGLIAATASVVCFCDCDGSLDPAQLPRVANPVLAGTADLVLGRRCPTTSGAWPPHARIANRVLAHRLRRQGIEVRDLGPMRAARRQDLLDLLVTDRRSGYPLETVLAASRHGWRITETDVDYAPRTGKSKVTGTVAGTVQAVRDMNRVWKQATG